MVLESVRKAAFDFSLSTSDQVRMVLGINIGWQAKRPRLTISLNSEDYQVLGRRFGLARGDHLAIKERVTAAWAVRIAGDANFTKAHVFGIE